MLSTFSCAYLAVCLLWSNVHFLIGLLFFCCWVVWVVCIFWRWSPCQVHRLQLFSPFLELSVCVYGFLCCAKAWGFLGTVCLFLFLFLLPWETDLRKHLDSWHQRMFGLCSKSFMVSCLMFKSLSHFEFVFVHSVRVCCSFIDLHASVQFSQHQLLKRLSLSRFICLPPLSKINWP